MNYRFSPHAKSDLFAAADFYESQRTGLGAEFSVDVGLALARVMEGPRRWPEMEDGIHRYRLNRFPYALIYRVAPPQTVEIIALFDLRRKPGTWRHHGSG